jgi:trigger factor
VKTAVEKASPTRAKLNVEVPFSELQEHIDAAYKKIAQQVQLPGFRKGKVPAAIIDRRFGRGAVLDEAINEAIPTLYTKALADNDLEPLGQPNVEVTDLLDNDHLHFAVEVDVKPEITVPDYAGTKVVVGDSEVTDDDVTQQLDGLRQRFGSLTDVDRPASVDDFVTIDLAAADVDGNELPDVATDGLSYQVGSEQGIEGLAEAVTGLSAGESATFRSTLAGGEVAGTEADVTVTVKQVREQELPELDDEFAQMASEFDTIDEFTEQIRGQVGRSKRLQQAADARDLVLEQLLEAAEIPLPESVVEDEVQTRRDSMTEQLEAYELSWDQYLEREGQTEEEFDADLRRRSEDALRGQFLLDEIAKVEQLTVNEGELTEHLVRRAQQAGASPEQFAQQVMENNYLPVLVREVVRGKALAHLVDAAEVVDPKGQTVDFSLMMGDGRMITPEEKAELEAVNAAASTDADVTHADAPEAPAADAFVNVAEAFDQREDADDEAVSDQAVEAADTEAADADESDATEPETDDADQAEPAKA